MFRLNFRQTLALTLAALMVRPFPMQAASAAVLGSMTSYGPVSVGSATAPAETTLFSGDKVSTETGNAVVQYAKGARVLLAKSSTAVFTPDSVELQKGHMTFRSTSKKDMVFQASSLRLVPTSDKTSANVLVGEDGKATISVTEGSLRAVDPTGAALALIPAGETKLFAMAVPPASAPAAPAASAAAAAPPVPGGGVAWFLIAAAGAGASVATVVLSQKGDNNEVVEKRAASTILP